MNSKKNISQIVCWALTAPPVAGCSSQAASDSDAATRRQAQNDDIASSNPRLVEKIVARGSLFVARKSLPLYSNGLWSNITTGRPLGVPYAYGHRPCFFLCPVTAFIPIA